MLFFIIVIILAIAGGYVYFKYFKTSGIKFDPKDYPICVDSDNGLTYNIAGSVILKQLITLNEGPSLRVISKNNAELNIGVFNREVELGKSYNFIESDQTYTENNASVLRNVSSTIRVLKIVYDKQDNFKNNIIIEKTTNNIDECVSKYNSDLNGLIENSCTRNIDEYYKCANACSNSACV